MRKYVYIYLLAAVVAACTDSPALPPDEPTDPTEIDSLVWDSVAYTDGLLRYALMGDSAVEVVTPDTAHLTLPAELTIPASVRIGDSTYPVIQIGHGCFAECYEIERVHLPFTIRRIRGGGFWSCNSLADINIPDSITYIGEEAFAGCQALTTFHLPSAMTEIERCVFASCTGLTEINIPPTVTAIKVGAFSGCSALTHVSIPAAVATLPYSTFAGCQALRSVTFAGPTQLGIYALARCPALSEIHCLSTTPGSHIDDTSFDPEAYNAVTLFVPATAVEAYRSHPCWGKFKITAEQ